MGKPTAWTGLVVAGVMLATLGCEESESQRLLEMAQTHQQRQAEQNQRMAQLQQQVAEGSRRLVEADAKAREEMAALQREVQAERSEIGRQRDVLEAERRDLAAQRERAPILAAAITNIGLLLACLLPLVVCVVLLMRRVEPADDSAVAEVLLSDVVSDRPLLLTRRSNAPTLAAGNADETPLLLDASHVDEDVS